MKTTIRISKVEDFLGVVRIHNGVESFRVDTSPLKLPTYMRDPGTYEVSTVKRGIAEWWIPIALHKSRCTCGDASCNKETIRIGNATDPACSAAFEILRIRYKSRTLWVKRMEGFTT